MWSRIRTERPGRPAFPGAAWRVDGEVVSSVYAWMISFAPYDFPRYAVAMMVEDGVSGGTTIGPRLSALYQKMFAYDGTLKTEVMQ